MNAALIWEWIIKSLILILGCTVGFAYVTLYERRFLARIQSRIGPNRTGKFGLLQPVADAVKLIFKEEMIPSNADKFIFILAPVITVIPSLIVLAVIPWGEPIKMFGREIELLI
ncbi:MAG: NADH-quinone oxidoreductase subunit H, partial [Calditrichales bacterium]